MSWIDISPRSRGQKLSLTAFFLLVFAASPALADHPEEMVGVWRLDREAVLDSAPAVTKALKAKGRRVSEQQVRSKLKRLKSKLELLANGKFIMRGRAPGQRRTQKTIGVWDFDGDLVLKPVRGHPIPPIKLRNGRLVMNHPVMHGLRLVYIPPSEAPVCVVDLSAYTKQARGLLLSMLMDATTKLVYKSFVVTLERTRLKLARYLQRKGLPRLWFQKKPKTFYQKFGKLLQGRKKGANIPCLSFLRELGENVTKVITVLQIAEAASAGAYKEAAIIATLESIAAYSPAAGVLIALGKAVKADWEAFAKRVDEKFYRKYYNAYYLDEGHRPKKTQIERSQKARFRRFMDNMAESFSQGGVGGAARGSVAGYRAVQLSGTIINFASASGHPITRRDLEVEEKDGRYRFKTAGARVAIWLLFKGFERTFKKDIKAEALRRALLHQNKVSKKATVDA
ncbi:MAG: hypothetical protein JRH20_31430, partial [Deltaproteobacteria bacterium]|nr:hypothetical protein [Deltaproteobacteria bacterium]